MELTPGLVLALWTAGIAAGAGLVAWWDVVGPGFLWVAAGSVVLFGAGTVVAGGGPAATAGVVLALVAAAAARSRIGATLAFTLSAGALAVSASAPVLSVVTAVVFFGGVTTEMLLGHWFLVDPTLPRRPLLRLAVLGGVGLVADVAWVLVSASLPLSGPDGVLTMAYGVLSVFTGVLLVGVWFSLQEPRYSGVMAATGLSYLAVLTSFGVVTLGRMLVAGTASGPI